MYHIDRKFGVKNGYVNVLTCSPTLVKFSKNIIFTFKLETSIIGLIEIDSNI